MSQRHPLAYQRDLFLTQFGLQPRGAKGQPWPASIHLAEGAMDPRTSGAVALRSRMDRDDETGTIRLALDYWYQTPNGAEATLKLSEWEFRTDPDTNEIIPTSIFLMGREVYGEEEGDPNTAARRTADIKKVQGALQQIHRALRDGNLPEIASIFKKSGAPLATGESLRLVGQNPEGGFNFHITDGARPHRLLEEQAGLNLPGWVAQALFGDNTNSIDPERQLEDGDPVSVINPQTQAEFLLKYAAATRANDNSGTIHTSAIRIDPLYVPEGVQARSLPEFAAVRTEAANDDRQVVRNFRVLGEDLLQSDPVTRRKIMEIIRRAKDSLRRRQYPEIMRDMTELGLLDWVEAANAVELADLPPPEGRMTVISKGGNNMQQIADGYGDRINGNCKYVEVSWLDKNGKPRRMGVLHDLGIFLPHNDEPNKGAVADVIRELEHVDHIFITHRHLDHLDGLIVYIAGGYLKNKTIHATPEVMDALRTKLRAQNIPADNYTIFDELKGRGWQHLKDEDGVTRLSIGYSVDGTPHTARCTPMLYVARNGDQVIDSYLNPGDMRFGRHNFEGYTGFKPDADYLDKEFFRNWDKLLAEHDPTVNVNLCDPWLVREETDPKTGRKTKRLNLVRFDLDGTSIQKSGAAPTDWEAQNFQNELYTAINKVLPGRMFGVSQISTNEMGYETRLRTATDQGRDLMVVGANLENTARTANRRGVNHLRLEARMEQNSQRYLDWYFKQQSDQKLAALGIRRGTITDAAARAPLEKEILMETRVQEYFTDLREHKQSNSRMERRDALEKLFAEEFGEHRHLGSILVSRVSKISNRMSEDPGRWMPLLTGTQGTNVEEESTLSKIADGRSIFDMAKGSKPTARPVPVERRALFIVQSAIPGNGEKQKLLIKKLVARGHNVTVAVQDGFEIHGLPKKKAEQIAALLRTPNPAVEQTRPRTVTVLSDGTLTATGMPIHAPGHGYEEDAKAWLKLVNALFPMLQHTDDQLSVEKFLKLCREVNGHEGYFYENFERVRTEKAGADTGRIFSAGRQTPSIIIFEIIRKIRQYYGGVLNAQQVIHNNGEGLGADLGLVGLAAGEILRLAFATTDGEIARKKAAAAAAPPQEPIDYNQQKGSKPVRNLRGPRRPGQDNPGLRAA